MSENPSQKEEENTDKVEQGLFWSFFHYTNKPKETADSKKNKTNKRNKNFQKYFYPLTMVFLTMLIIRFMAVQNGISKDTAHRQLRAYLIPNTPELTVPQESLFVYIEEGRLPVKYAIRNNGQTPAYDVRDAVNVRTLRRGDRPVIIADTVRNFYHPVYGANTEHKRIIHSGKNSFTADYFFLKNGKLIFEAGIFDIYVWGRIEYTDTFKDSHWTEFCYEFVFDPLIKEFRAYETCNQADREEPYNPFLGIF